MSDNEKPVLAESGRIGFPLGLEYTRNRPSVLVEQRISDTELGRQLERIGIQTPDVVIMFSGGAGLMNGEEGLELFKGMVRERVDRFVNKGKRVLIVTGGTDSGFMRVVGQAMEQVLAASDQAKDLVQVLGVSPKDVVTFASVEENGKFPVAPGHTHHVIVDAEGDDKFGDETIVIQRILGLYNKGEVIASAVVGNGGKGTATEIRAFIDVGYPVLLLKDSMRMATLVGLVLASPTYADYLDILEKTIEVANDGTSVDSERQKTLAERNNIFAILRPSDDGVMIESTDHPGNIAANETNYAILRKLLSESVVKHVTADEINTWMANQQAGIAGAIRQLLFGRGTQAERQYWTARLEKLRNRLRIERHGRK